MLLRSVEQGAGAIAAMQFNALDFITVEAVGFGCPSLLSPELSESTKDYITTVVTDADVIPRMSGSTMANVILDVVEFDWTKSAKDDINFTLGRAEEATPIANIKHLLPPKENVIQWAEDFFNRTSAQSTSKPRNRLAVSLIPPGNCIHFFRDGVGFTSTYTPCKFFSSIEFSRTMVEDHLVMPGYHRALITFMRDWTQDFNVSFRLRRIATLGYCIILGLASTMVFLLCFTTPLLTPDFNTSLASPLIYLLPSFHLFSPLYA